MKVAGEHRFDASPEVVFNGLQDPEVLAATMPGCEKMEMVGEHQYEGAIKIKIGPVQGLFQGRVELADIDPPNGYTMKVDGKGGPGFVKATARIELVPDGDGTIMKYDGDAQVGGRIASIGQRLVDSSSKVIIKQSLEGLGATLAARAAASNEAPAASADDGSAEDSPDASEPAVTPDPVPAPSQAEFASRVAQEVVKDLVPKPVVIAIVVIVIALIAFFVFR